MVVGAEHRRRRPGRCPRPARPSRCAAGSAAAAGGGVAAGGAVGDPHRLAVLGHQVVRVARRVARAAACPRPRSGSCARGRRSRRPACRDAGAGSRARRRSRRRTRRSRRSARTRWRRGPACRSRRPRPAGRTPSCRPRSRLIALRVIAGRLGSAAGRLSVLQRCAGVPSPSVATGPLHSVVMLPPVNRPSTGLPRSHRREAGGVGDVLVALALGVVDHVCRRPARRDRLEEAVAAAAQHDVDLVIDRLLGDRAEAARGLGLRRAGRARVVRTLAAAQGDVRVQHRRRRVGDLRGRDVAGLHARASARPRAPCGGSCPGSSRRRSDPARSARRCVFSPVAHIVPVEAESGS